MAAGRGRCSRRKLMCKEIGENLTRRRRRVKKTAGSLTGQPVVRVFATLLFPFERAQPLDEHLWPLGTGEVVFHSRGYEVADAVAAFFVEIEVGGDT